MTESQAEELRRAAWRINRLCAYVAGGRLDPDMAGLVNQSRESAAKLREIAGPLPVCNGNGG